MVEEDSLRGVTSNPAIFEKAILGSPDYDDELAARSRDEGLTAREVYRRMAVTDVQLAADVLRPVYDETGGDDGYVSLEVAPRLAHDTEGTLEQARMYWGLVDRPNLMIKIPATDEGIPAIEEALYEGMNVNVTLLFAVAALRARDGGVHPRDGAPPRGRASRSTATRSPRSSSRASTPRSTSGSRPPAARELAGPRRARQRARRLPGVPARLRRRALRRAARGGLPGPAAAVGVDRRQEPGLPARRCTSTASSARDTRQHDAAADAARPPRARAR